MKKNWLNSPKNMYFNLTTIRNNSSKHKNPKHFDINLDDYEWHHMNYCIMETKEKDCYR